jgi:phosphohistidine phosphatase
MAATTLLLLRHGIAEERRPDLADGDRGLTGRGRDRTREVVERLVALGLTADRLLSSPLLRARQTAEIAVAAGWATDLTLTAELAPGGAPLSRLPQWCEACGGDGLALVGHEPDLSTLACQLIGAPPGCLALRKAGLIQLQLPVGAAAGQAVLVSLLRPRLLLG